MPNAVQLILGFAPGLLWLWWVCSKDDWEPEPAHHVLAAFTWGVLSAIAVVFWRPAFEGLLPQLAPRADALVDAFVVTAFFEEFAKASVLVVGCSWFREWDEPIDGIVYGAAVGLGFASFENVVYLSIGGATSVVLVRAFTATLVHATCTACVGFLLGLGKSRSRWRALTACVLALALATLAHGTYDALLSATRASALVSLLVLLPFLLSMLSFGLRWSRSRSPLHHPIR